MPRLVLYPGSLLDIETDVIVNAANSSLMGGGGVDGVIHYAAGPALKEACRPLAPCPPGEVRVTEGFGLAPRLIFHTAGPIWQGGDAGEAELLRACYANCLAELVARNLSRIVFPAISTGVYGYPSGEAAEIAVRTCGLFEAAYTLHVTFAAFEPRTGIALESALAAFRAEHPEPGA